MQWIDIKTVSLDVIGFCMRAEAGRIEGDIIPVSRTLWLEIADRLKNENGSSKPKEDGVIGKM